MSSKKLKIAAGLITHDGLALQPQSDVSPRAALEAKWHWWEEDGTAQCGHCPPGLSGHRPSKKLWCLQLQCEGDSCHRSPRFFCLPGISRDVPCAQDSSRLRTAGLGPDAGLRSQIGKRSTSGALETVVA